MRVTVAAALLGFAAAMFAATDARPEALASAPAPLLKPGLPVDWWFVFKLNSAVFPGCGGTNRSCPFGGTVQNYRTFGQQYVYASSDQPALTQGGGCVGDSTNDPLGATFDQVFNAKANFVIWNDQFYGHPLANRPAPWGHSKGMVAWSDAGEGVLLQVSTPSWPAAGSKASPRRGDGNTLGCVKDNDVEVSQHFFAVRLTKDDLVTVLHALAQASVVTDPTVKEIVHNGGPPDVQKLVSGLGRLSAADGEFRGTLSTGIQVLAKPSRLQVPPWQMVSALLGGPALRTATWWTTPTIPSTTASTRIRCWDSGLGTPGAVEIATDGRWNGQAFSLKGGAGANANHAKVGVSTSGAHPFVIFGDLNQQGALAGDCGSSQNGRGGLFLVVENTALASSVSSLIGG